MKTKFYILVFLLFSGLAHSAQADCPVAPSLDTWLQEHPNVSQSLQWPFQHNLLQIQPNVNVDIFKKPITSLPGITKPQNSSNQTTSPSLNPSTLRHLNYLQTYNLKPWQDWPADAKEELRNNFINYWNWMCKAQDLYKTYEASGFQTKPQGFDEIFSVSTDLDPKPLTLDPPNNLGTTDTNYTILSPQDAWKLYVKNTAFRLLVEIGKVTPWSLNDYNKSQIEIILSGASMFKKTSQGFELLRAMIPTSPLRVYSFLAQNKLLGKTREETFQKILEWERINLFHANLPYELAKEVDYKMMPALYCHHDGNPSALCMLQATQCIYKNQTCSDIHHYSLGCSGTSFLNAYLFETLNIPSETKFITPTAHMTWCSMGKCATHGDDPYALKSASDIMQPKGPASMLEILVSEDQFNTWFNKNNPKAADYIGRSTVDMDLKYISLRLLRNYCNDGADKPHAEGEVFQKFSHLYSIEELESQQLWKKMDDKLKSLGGCDVVPYF